MITTQISTTMSQAEVDMAGLGFPKLPAGFDADSFFQRACRRDGGDTRRTPGEMPTGLTNSTPWTLSPRRASHLWQKLFRGQPTTFYRKVPTRRKRRTLLLLCHLSPALHLRRKTRTRGQLIPGPPRSPARRRLMPARTRMRKAPRRRLFCQEPRLRAKASRRKRMRLRLKLWRLHLMEGFWNSTLRSEGGPLRQSTKAWIRRPPWRLLGVNYRWEVVQFSYFNGGQLFGQ